MAGPCGICTRFPILLLQPQQAPETQIKEPMRSQTTIVLLVLSSEVCPVASHSVLQKDSGVAGLQKHQAAADLCPTQCH